MSNERRVTWVGLVPPKDDFGDPIVDEFIDGKTKYGPWACMTLASWGVHGVGHPLGTGVGQRYKRDPDSGHWVKVEG